MSVDMVLTRHGLGPYLDAPAELHELLRSPFRKRVLRELDGAEDSLAARELAERLARTQTVDITDPADALVRLYHVHIPKLESRGLIEVCNKSNGKIVKSNF